MAMSKELRDRSKNECELCGNKPSELIAYVVSSKNKGLLENEVALCENCHSLLQDENFTDATYWRFLTGSIWSEVPVVQALSFRILSKLKDSDWAVETLETVYLDDEILAWANADNPSAEGQLVHKDANGNVLQTGDNVLLTQNLNVKGTNFIAPKGTKVLKIRLVPDNDEHIEGKVNGSTIVILTKYVKKA